MSSEKPRELSPMQSMAKDYYIDPKSPTFSNKGASMLRAGYSLSSSKSPDAHTQNWLDDQSAVRVSMISKAQSNLKSILDLELKIDRHSDKNTIDIVKLQADVSKFTLERLASGVYNRESEASVPNVVINITEYKRPEHVVRDIEAI